jgi:hypothetical protein
MPSPSPPPIIIVSVVHSQAKSNSVHPVLEMLMGGDLTAEWRCELHVSTDAAVWRQKPNVARQNGGACLEFLPQVAKLRATRLPQHKDCKLCALRRRAQTSPSWYMVSHCTGLWSRSYYTGLWSRSHCTRLWARSHCTGLWSRSHYTGLWSHTHTHTHTHNKNTTVPALIFSKLTHRGQH